LSRDLVRVAAPLLLALLSCAGSLACDRAQPDGAATEAAPGPLDSLFAVVSARADTVCVRALKKPLGTNDTVLVALPAEQRWAHATVIGPVPMCPNEGPTEGDLHFRLSGAGIHGAPGIVVLAKHPQVGTGLTTDLDRDGVPESYRSCTSAEGVHLSVWAGQRRLWHYYYYVGYDLEPTCTDADFPKQ
jgi:hypothetical protein